MDEHITRHLLHAIHKGWRNPGDLAAIALAHLFEHCPVCRKEFEVWRRQAGEGVARPVGGDFDAALDRVCGVDGSENDELASEAARVEAERRKALSRAEELLALPVAEQLDRIRTESRGQAGPLLAEALIEESRRKAPGYPWEAITLANLARTVLQHADATLYAAELYARALAHLANAIRVTGDLPRSEQILLDARYFLRSQGGGDRLVRAELDSLEASLRLSQRRQREAIQPLFRAHAVYRMDGDLAQTAVVLSQLSKAHNELGENDRALILLQEARLHAQGSCNVEFEAMILGNRSQVLADMGEIDAAWESLRELESPERARRGSLRALRQLWQEAYLFRASDEMVAFEAAMTSVFQGYRNARIHFAAAVAASELAELYVRQGLWPEAEELATEALDVFEQVQVPTKAIQARRLRDQAASRSRTG